MNHEPWLDQLPWYAAGKLSAEDRAALEHHLESCETCRAAADSWTRIAAEVRQEAAGRVHRLPPFPALPHDMTFPDLPLSPRPPFPAAQRKGEQSQRSPLHQRSTVGRGHRGGANQPQETMMNIPYPYALPRATQRRQPAITLAAAILIVILFAGGLFLLSGREGRDPQPDPLSAGAVGQTTSATPTPFPTMLPTTVTPQSTDTSTPAPMQEYTATPVPFAPAGDSLPASINLSMMVDYEVQEWNNQGPASLVMALSYWGVDRSQDEAADWLKPNPEDKHVSPEQMTYYVNQFTDLRAIYRVGGTVDLMRSLLAAGLPVIVQMSIQPEGDEWMGHYGLLVGYDDTQGQFLTFDSYLGSNQGQGRPVAYDTLDESWRHFNRTFLVVYNPQLSGQVRAALGAYIDPSYAVERAFVLESARSEINGVDAWTLLNVGNGYAAMGEYSFAASNYDRAFEIGLPWRLLWYQFGPYEAYLNAGRPEDVITLANATLETTPYSEEAYYWRALAYAAQGDLDAAGDDLAQALRLNPNFFQAQAGAYHIEANPLQIIQMMPQTDPNQPDMQPTVVPPLDIDITATPILMFETTPTPVLMFETTPTAIQLSPLDPTAVPPTIPPTIPPTATLIQ